MKRNYFLLLPFLILGPLFGQAYENPINWYTSNSYSTYNSAGATVSKSTDAKGGLFAARLEGKNAALLGKTIPGVITTGILKGGINVSGGQLYTIRSQKLTGYYKYSPQGADMAGFEVLLTKWNPTTLKRDTIAYGNVSKGAAAGYTAFNVPLTYKTTDAPDSQLVVISSSADRLNAIAGSVLLIDGLLFIGDANTECVPVLASSNDGNLPENVLDNNLQTRWSAKGDGQWIEFCLETENEVDGVEIAFHSGKIRKSIFDVLTSLDRVTWTNVALGLTSCGTSNDLEKFSFNKIMAKYVRIVGHGNSLNLWNSYCEVKLSYDTAPAEKNITSNNNYNVGSKIFDVYPNPANDILYITVGENSIIQIFNINGSQVVYQSNVEENQIHSVDVKGLTAGIYLVKVSNNKFIKTQKVVINKP